MEFCRRSLAGGNVWDYLADLLKIMKLRGVGADDVKEVREIVQHLFKIIVKLARSKRDSRQAKTHVDNLLLQLVDDILSMWKWTFSWIEPKNWQRRQSISMQNTLLQSLTGVAQLKKERRQEDDSVNR